MYAAVRVIYYIAESVASWEKENGLVVKLWASIIRFGYCAILTVLHAGVWRRIGWKTLEVNLSFVF